MLPPIVNYKLLFSCQTVKTHHRALFKQCCTCNTCHTYAADLFT